MLTLTSLIELILNPRGTPKSTNAHFSYFLTILDISKSTFCQILKVIIKG
nr:MAG TPA: hypothetical protein [Caudoviricetes sp.]